MDLARGMDGRGDVAQDAQVEPEKQAAAERACAHGLANSKAYDVTMPEPVTSPVPVRFSNTLVPKEETLVHP
jgi:hypothetical protein